VKIYTSGKPEIATYRVDYDTAEPLKKKYGVVTQHTFVLIDGKGNALKKVEAPTDAQLEALVRGEA
jgi:hypothetical protein